jgi:hypothetical protein
MNWCSLTEVAVGDDELCHMVSEALLVRPGYLPKPADKSTPLRVRVILPDGWHPVGNAWLQSPVLHRDSSEIDCSCKPSFAWEALPSAPPQVRRVKIDVWGPDIERLNHHSQPAPKRGRKNAIDWDSVVRPFVFEQLDYHGWPDASDPEWNSQAAVEKAVTEHINGAAGVTRVRAHTARYMAEWRKQKAGK